MYRHLTSPWASPFVRFCGDYRWLNAPRVQYEVEKAMGIQIFFDIDITNSYHQFPLTATSSQTLAIQSPWGLVEPLFLPDGVSPASGHLQWTMMQMFGVFDEWSIVIFDNVLLSS